MQAENLRIELDINGADLVVRLIEGAPEGDIIISEASIQAYRIVEAPRYIDS